MQYNTQQYKYESFSKIIGYFKVPGNQQKDSKVDIYFCCCVNWHLVNMPFDISDKVAIVTGGASGIGFNYVKELLRNGLKVRTLGLVCFAN